MKKFLIAGLLTAIAAVSLISQASAASRYCFENPDDPQCYQNDGPNFPPPPPPPPPVFDGGNGYPPPPPPPPRYGDNGYPPPPNRFRPRHRPVYNDNYYGDGYDQGAVFSFQFGNSGNSCADIADSLSRSGFRRVKPVDCAGREYGYVAYRDGQRLKIRVRSATGRIFGINPY